LLGTTLDNRFELQSFIAQGGFAAVYKGRDTHRQGSPCAIKIFRNELIDSDWLTHRFNQEVASLKKINHPAVVSIYGHGISPTGAPYLVLEYVEGGTLRDLLNAGPIPLARSGSLLNQAAVALCQLHNNGIFHRDFKPENVMLRAGAPPGSELVLIDFSIAIIQAPDQTIHGLSRAAGTICYMAPEQAVGFASAATDIYSLAKVALEMFTGLRISVLLPDAGMDLPDRVKELARTLPLQLSEESIDLLGSALQFDPVRRPHSVLDFARPIVRDLTSHSFVP
jgi:serine/threonine-protein kinase